MFLANYDFLNRKFAAGISLLAMLALPVLPAAGQTTITTLAGNGLLAFSGDGGAGNLASLDHPKGIAVSPAGEIYVADASNRRIRKFTVGGNVTTVSGNGVEGFSGDGGAAVNAMLGRPTGLAFNSGGTLYFSDSTNQRVRAIYPNGTIQTVAGTGEAGFSGDGGTATAAKIQFPLGVAVDGGGNVYFADGDNARVRRISTQGTISTVAGKGSGGYSGDGGAATAASINIPSDVAFDASGNMYIADAGNNRVRKVDTFGNISTFAGTGVDGFSGDGGAAAQAQLNFPWGLATNSSGGVYIADRVNSRVRLIGPGATGGGNTGNPPVISSSGIVNAASFSGSAGVSPGSLVSIFGTDMSVGQSIATNLPLPTSMGGTVVTFNGIPAPLIYVSPTQLNVQVPYELSPGVAFVQVKSGANVSANTAVTISSMSPGIFIINQAANTGAVLHANYTLVNAASPAHPGEFVLIFGTGFGLLNRSVATGAAAPTTPPFAETLQLPTVTIGGQNATVSFSGLAPGFAGLYQLNVKVPDNLPSGNYQVQVSAGGRTSNTATLAVAQ